MMEYKAICKKSFIINAFEPPIKEGEECNVEKDRNGKIIIRNRIIPTDIFKEYFHKLEKNK